MDNLFNSQKLFTALHIAEVLAHGVARTNGRGVPPLIIEEQGSRQETPCDDNGCQATQFGCMPQSVCGLCLQYKACAYSIDCSQLCQMDSEGEEGLEQRTAKESTDEVPWAECDRRLQ